MTPLIPATYRQIAKTPRRYVVFENDFSTGHEGWQGLIVSGTNYYPTLHAGSLTGPQSLCIDTRGGAANVTASATKRLNSFVGKWYLTFRFAWNAKADASGPEQNSLDRIAFVLDWQSGATNRKWFEMRYIHYVEGSSAIVPSWNLSDGSANAFNPITEVGAYELGYNQANKWDFHEVVLSFDANGAASKWDELILDGKRYDISAYNCSVAQSEVAEFDNGSNIVVQCKNRTSNSSADPYVLLDYVRCEWEEVG